MSRQRDACEPACAKCQGFSPQRPRRMSVIAITASRLQVEVLEANAMGRFPDCKYARVVKRPAFPFELVEVVQLWRSSTTPTCIRLFTKYPRH